MTLKLKDNSERQFSVLEVRIMATDKLQIRLHNYVVIFMK